jgi:Holliday junction DNA helicase RuvA
MTTPPRQLAGWIEAGDVKALSRLPGVGARTAEHIVATLRGKLDAFALAGAAPAEKVFDWTDAQRAAVEVLVQWGDSRADAERWLQRAARLHPDAAGPDEWVRLAYRIKTGLER